MTNLNRSNDNDLLAALRHPLRRQILRRMVDEEAISPREIASSLDLPLSNISYHVRVLADCAAISLVSTKPVRGSMQHFYRATSKRRGRCRSLAKAEGDEAAGGEFRRVRRLSRQAMDDEQRQLDADGRQTPPPSRSCSSRSSTSTRCW